MKKFEVILVLLVFLIFGILKTNAQKISSNEITNLPKPKLSLSVGSTIPGNTTKDAFVNNAQGIGLDYSLPVTKGWGKKSNYLGLLFGGQYNFSNSQNFDASSIEPFQVFGQTSNTVTYKENNVNGAGFRLGLGPQLNFNLSKRLIVSPMLLGEYFSINLNEINAIQTIVSGGQTTEVDIWKLSEEKTTGFAITPKIRLQYLISKNIGIFMDGSYILGPKIDRNLTSLIPIGNPNDLGQYDIQQLTFSKETLNTNVNNSFNALVVNLGVVFSLNTHSKKGYDYYSNKSDMSAASISGSNNQTNLADKKDCIEYDAPEILNFQDQGVVQLDKGNLHLQFKRSNAEYVNYRVIVTREKKKKTEILHNKVYPSDFNGTIENLKIDKDKTEEIQVQMQAIAPTKENIKPIKGDKAAFQKAYCSTFKNNGNSNTAVYYLKNSPNCLPSFTNQISKIECSEDKKIKVTGSYSITLPQGITGTLSMQNWTVMVAGNPVSMINPSININSFPNNNIVSATVYNYTFELEATNLCDKNIYID